MTTLTTTSPIALSFNAKFDRCRIAIRLPRKLTLRYPFNTPRASIPSVLRVSFERPAFTSNFVSLAPLFAKPKLSAIFSFFVGSKRSALSRCWVLSAKTFVDA